MLFKHYLIKMFMIIIDSINQPSKFWFLTKLFITREGKKMPNGSNKLHSNKAPFNKITIFDISS